MLLCFHAVAASANDNWNSSFGMPGASDAVGASAYVGANFFVTGTFRNIGGINASCVARYDGTNWHSLGEGLNGEFTVPQTLAYLHDSLYVGGVFRQAGTSAVNNIARWDGTNWWPCGSGVAGIVRQMAVFQGNLIVGGSFSSAGGVPAANIARWDGTNWSALGTGVTWPYSGPAVDSLAASASELYVGGRFRTAGGVAAMNVAKWNGSSWSALGNGLRYNDGPDWAGNGIVRAMVMSQGRLFAGGEFSKAGDTTVANISAWDGTNWTAIGADLGTFWVLTVNGSDVFAGGFFNGPNHVAKWTGSSWVALGSGAGGGPDGGAVWGLAANGSELFVGGRFEMAGSQPANNIALWHIPHALSASYAGETATLSWPATGTNFLLEAKESIADTNWTVVATHPAVIGDQCRVTNPINSSARFFRLRRK